MRIKIGRHRSRTTPVPPGSQDSSYLVDETFFMEKERREKEQQGHRQLAKVNAVEHQEPSAPGPEGELQNDIQGHPKFKDRQDLDGIEIGPDNPIPALNTEARREFDNAELEKQLRYKLEHNLMPDTAPKPNKP